MADLESLHRLQLLHPKIRNKAIDAYNEVVKLTPVGIHPYITETYRSFERSDDLYAQGRTKPGSIVTNARGGSSLHNYSLAIDFVLMVNGKMDWTVNHNWMVVVNIFKQHGFKWGGEFKSIKDYPHFENTFGYTVKQLLAKYNAKDFIPGTNYLNI